MSVWSVSLEDRAELRAHNSVWKWKSQFRVNHLFDLWTSNFAGFNSFNFQNLNGRSTCTMPSSHITVTLSNSTADSNISVFSVHVVGSTSRVVSQPNSKVLDWAWVLLRDLWASNNLTDSFLQFLVQGHEVPESWLSRNNIWSKDSHAEERWFWNFVSWDTSSDDLEFFQLKIWP